MAISVAVDMTRNFSVPAGFDKVFSVLSDVPVSAGHFPKVDRLTDLGGNAFRWEMEKVGIDKYSIQTIYASKYVSDKNAGTVSWSPVTGEGNASVEGSWTIKSQGSGTSIQLRVKGVLTVPLPSLAKIVVAPVARREFEGMVDKYVENLKKTFAS